MAILRVKDKMREGASLMQMNTPRGKRWYVVPGPQVDEEIAKHVVAEADVFPSQDGLFPGISQTYKIGSVMSRPNPASPRTAHKWLMPI
jgi:hypothetical protein